PSSSTRPSTRTTPTPQPGSSTLAATTPSAWPRPFPRRTRYAVARTASSRVCRVMSIGTAVALVLVLLSAAITNLAYLREHDAAAVLPVLSMRRPLHSLQLLLADRSWLLGF